MNTHQNRIKQAINPNPGGVKLGAHFQPSAYDQATKNDVSRNKFIQDDLPEYFGVKAVKKQRSVIKGRNPISLPKDDELWHYSKVSTERHKRVRGGKGFWATVEDSAKMHEIETPVKDTEDKEPQFGMNPSPISPPPTAQTGQSRPGTSATTASNPTFKASSLQAQLKTAMSNTAGDLNLKVDFTHRSLIHFNMTFIIMNYNNEVIYVDKNNELRVKPLENIKSTDRIKFKVVDLSNPSNPTTIQFGDNLWLQLADGPDSSGIDTTFQTGSVVTTKVFDSTEVKALNYEHQLQNHEIQRKKADERRRANHNKLLNLKITTPLPAGTKQNNMTMKPQEKVKLFPHEMEHLTSETSLSNNDDSSLFDGDEHSVASMEADNDGFTNENNPVDPLSKSSSNINKAVLKPRISGNEEYSRKTKICGYSELTRIVDPKKVENIADTTLLSDEKAARYLSRNALHLGKWTVDTGVRMHDTARVKEFFFNNVTNNITGRVETDSFDDLILNFKNNDPEALKEFIQTHLLSLTPIIIQQDQYCLSTATFEEYRQWPLNSSYIIHTSKFISNEQRELYEDNFQKFLNNQIRFDILGLGKPAIMKSRQLLSRQQAKNSAHHQIMMNKERELNGGGSSNSNSANPPLSPHAMNILNGIAAMTGEHSSTTTSSSHHNTNNNTTNSSGHNNHSAPVIDDNQDGFVCLRRIVKRPPPYEFAVDRRCVWKICLYEQFSDNYLQTEREKEVKRVMETATMVLKLSKMNREGARVHIESNHEDNLPSLVSGESFPQKLREITFKLQQKKNQEYLLQRRIKESNLQDYFSQKINNVLEDEESGFIQSKHALRGIHAEKSMMSMDSSTTNSPKTAAAGFAQFLSSLEEVEGENDFSSIDWQSMNDDNDRRNTSLIERLQRQGSQVKLNTSIAMTPTIRAPSAAPTPANRGRSKSPKKVTINTPSHQKQQQQQQQGHVHHPRSHLYETPPHMKNGVGKDSPPDTQKFTLLNSVSDDGQLPLPSMSLNSLTVPTPKHASSPVKKSQQSLQQRPASAMPVTSSSTSMLSPTQASAAQYAAAARNLSTSISTPLFPPRPKTSSSATAKEHRQSNISKHEYSEDIKKYFDTSIVPPYQKKLILNNMAALHEFDDLTAGEQLLSYHKTFRHINRSAKVKSYSIISFSLAKLIHFLFVFVESY
jgi:hypothetical protein